jgi:transketolase
MLPPVSSARLAELARVVRRHCLVATTHAGSGHPTSSLSAADLLCGLFFGGALRYDINEPQNPNNDRIIFSKGHASPLYYALWAVAGKIASGEIMTYRQFGSRLQGHPTPAFPCTEAATGSLGQGLAIGLGIAYSARRLVSSDIHVYVLLGDSEMAEGSQWEAIQFAAHHRLGNLIGILDVNRLGQRGETMLGHDTAAHARRLAAFGWETHEIDGHDLSEIHEAFARASTRAPDGPPLMIVARTIKGKGVSLLEDADDWHGKPLDADQLRDALAGLGNPDPTLNASPASPLGHAATVSQAIPRPAPPEQPLPPYELGAEVATRVAYGAALARLFPSHPAILSLDAEVSNSTGAATFKKEHPDRFIEMFIAEQNMVGVALGLSRLGWIPFVSTFAAFFTRAGDQIRMARYSNANIKFVGSHAGLSIGEDGPSQMGLEDIALFRAVPDSVVLHPCDAVSTEALVQAAAVHDGIVYLRTLRQKTPVLYSASELFPIGGSKILRRCASDVVTVVAAGATVHEALTAHDQLLARGVSIRVLDAYSIKPLHQAALVSAARDTGALVVVEDHYPAGGLGEAVLSALAGAGVAVPTRLLAVREIPPSGTGEQLREHAGISARAIVAETEALLARLKTPQPDAPASPVSS